MQDHPLPPRSGISTSSTLAIDAATRGVRGRGATFNPANRFETLSLEILPDDAGPASCGEPPLEIETVGQDGLGDWSGAGTLSGAGSRASASESTQPDVEAAAVRVKTRVYRDAAKSIINKVDSPDVGFSWTVNPYRGCEHGCIYCYARPGHEYLGMSSGLDFESRIMAKFDAPDLLRKAMMKPSWQGETIILSGVTDAYQPVERTLGITRKVLEVMVEFRQPIAIITKSRLVLRDLDLLAKLNEHCAVSVAISLTTLDPGLARILEPRAASPAHRLAAIRTLAEAGIPVRVMTAPLIPAINDNELESLLEAAKQAGATNAGYVLIRLPHQLKELFVRWLGTHYPDRAAKVESLIRQTRGGAMYDAKVGQRFCGTGPIAEMIKARFHLATARLGLNEIIERGPSPFRRSPGWSGGVAAAAAERKTKSDTGQLFLFGSDC